MHFFKQIFRIALVLIILAIPCFFIYEGLWTEPVSAAELAEQKAALQEQLGQELRDYYMGADNWRECRRLINQIDKLDQP